MLGQRSRQRTCTRFKEREITPKDAPSESSCPVCGSKQLRVFFEMLSVPVFCNLLWTNRDAARNCTKGDIKLAFCSNCSHIMNIAFNPSLLNYNQAYENPLDYSPRFQAYMQLLAKEMVERYKLYNKDIISIGCGKGAFLLMVCELGNNRGIGIDPSFVEQDKHEKMSSHVKFIRDYYSEKYANYKSDLITCRHVLEHIYNPKDFLSMLRRSIGNSLNTRVFFEVPNAINIFHNLFVFDIFYEHYSYFTPVSLSRIFSLSGFSVYKLVKYFKDQFLCLHALPSNQITTNLDYVQTNQVNEIAKDLTSFAAAHRRIVETWKRKLKHIADKGQRVVIWGTGARGVTFLNTFKNSHIKYAVDINPRKQGTYVAGTGQQIVPPEFLREHQPDYVIVMNPIYKQEIIQYSENLGLSARFENFLHPSIH